MIARLKQRVQLRDRHLSELVWGTATAFLIRGLAIVATFVLNLVLARLLGAEGFGLFSLCMASVLIGSAFANLGFVNALIRYVAAAVATHRPGQAKSILRFALIRCGALSAAISMMLWLLAPAIEDTLNQPGLSDMMKIMAWALLPYTLFRLLGASLIGLKKIRDSALVQNVLTPLCTLLLVAPLISHSGNLGACWAYLLACFLCLGYALWRWQHYSQQLGPTESMGHSTRIWSDTLPLMWVGVVQMSLIWLPVLMLGFWLSSDQVGVFSAAVRISLLISFIMIATNNIAAPKFAALHASRDNSALQQIITWSTRLMVLFVLPVMPVFWFFPDFLLGLFGPEFMHGSTVLVILSLGQLVNVLTGSTGPMLMMTGKGRLLRNVFLLALLVNIILNLLLIPRFGILGAAIALSLAQGVQHGVTCWLIYQRMGLVMLPWFPRRWLHHSGTTSNIS